MFARLPFIVLTLIATLFITGCGPGRGEAMTRSRQVVLPNGTTVALTSMSITKPVGDPAIDSAITQASQADDTVWAAVASSNAWITLLYEFRKGLTRDQQAARIKRQQLEEWYRTERSERDKAEAFERQMAFYDAVSAQVAAGTAEVRQRELFATAAERIVPAITAYEALFSVLPPDDALLRTVATYNRGVLTGLSGRIPAAKALFDEAHGYAVGNTSVDIIRQCLRAKEHMDALQKQQVMLQLDERERRQ
jgi:hypothetical protein